MNYFVVTVLALVVTLALISVQADPEILTSKGVGCVHIENVAYRRFLFPAEAQRSGGHGRPPAPRTVYYDHWDWLADESRNWTLERSGDRSYRIYSGVKPSAAYLYLNDRAQFDDDRRQVFASTAAANMAKCAEWKLEWQKSGYFTIRNQETKEYLYAGERKFDVNYECRHSGWHNHGSWGKSRCRSVGQVFAWKGKKLKSLGLEFQWAVVGC